MKGKKHKKQPKYSVFATAGQGSMCVAENIKGYTVKKLVEQLRGSASIKVVRDDGEVVTEEFV